MVGLTCDGKDLLEHVLCHARGEAADVEVGGLGLVSLGAVGGESGVRAV